MNERTVPREDGYPTAWNVGEEVEWEDRIDMPGGWGKIVRVENTITAGVQRQRLEIRLKHSARLVSMWGWQVTEA